MSSWNYDYEDLMRRMEEWEKGNDNDFVLSREDRLVRLLDEGIALHPGKGLTSIKSVLTPAELLSLIVFTFKSGYFGTGLLSFSNMSSEHPGAPWLGKHGLGVVKSIVRKPDWWEVEFQPATASMAAFAGRADCHVAAFTSDGYVKTAPLKIHGFNFDSCRLLLDCATKYVDVAEIISRIERGDKVMLTWVRGNDLVGGE